jgi:hypothetical protein
MAVYDPPVATYIPLQTITLGATTSSVTFASIPQTYRDLIVVAQRRTVSGSNSEKVHLNGDTTGSNYSRVLMYGTGSSTGSTSGANDSTAGITTTISQTVYQFMDASATDKHTTFLVRDNNTSSLVTAGTHRWANTDAITSITLLVESNSYAAGATFSIYGIEA